MIAKPNIVAILLAAGASRRMQGEDKLLKSIGEDADGAEKSLLRHSAEQISAANVVRTIIVVRQDRARYQAMLTDLSVEVLEVSQAADGMSESLKAGIQEAGPCGPNVDGYLIALADMPALTSAHYNLIVATFASKGAYQIVRPQTQDGRFGHPVCFDARLFDEFAGLQGDRGALEIIKRNQDIVKPVLMDNAIHVDLDTRSAWEAWQQKSD